MTARDDLLERLVAVESSRPDSDCTTNWYRNPDGPEAKARIEALEGEVARLKLHPTAEQIWRQNVAQAEAQRDEAVKALEAIDAAVRQAASMSEAGYHVGTVKLSENIYGITTPALASIKGKTNEQ